MSTNTDRIVIPGSNRPPVVRSVAVRPADPTQRIRVSIYARRNANPSAKALAAVRQLNSAELPRNRQYPSADDVKEVYGADAADLKQITAFATAAKLKVVDVNPESRRVRVEGTIADIEKAFNTELKEFDHPDGNYRGREGELSVPASLGGIIEGVEGLDTRPIGNPLVRRSRFTPTGWEKFVSAAKPSKTRVTHATQLKNKWPGTFFPTEVAELYNYPSNLDGSKQNIAIFAFNGTGPDPRGGYSLAALKTYFEKVLGGKTPAIKDVVIQGPGNDPGPDSQSSSQKGDSTGEVMLDMCVIGSVAPGASIFMYFTEFTSQGWVDALNDAISGHNDISVISISYGNPEDDPDGAWTPMGVKLVNQAFEAAAAKGITICCASGDDGSSDQSKSGAHADFPASSPNVLGVGGTSLVAAAGPPLSIASEVVWNDLMLARPEGAGGGGISSVFSKPTYQNNVSVPPSANPPHKIGRGVPDVSAVADPETGVVIMRIDGKNLEPIGGTSASAPLWAALIARLNQGLNARVGFLNPVLYGKFAAGVLRDIVSGNNGAYESGPGWDACTGLGSPHGTRLLHALSGTSQT
jgi:kumamolisin